MRKAFLLTVSALAAVTALGAAPAFPDDAVSPLANRPQELPPVLRFLTAKGVKLTWIGDQGGVHGYLAEEEHGKMQPVYVTPDGEHLLVGILVRNGGVNETGIQIGEMQQRWADAKRQMDAAQKQFGGASASSLPAAPPSVPAIASALAPAAPPPVPDQQPPAGPRPPDATLSGPAAIAPAPAVPAPGSAVAAAPAPVPAAASAQAFLSPFQKDKFLADAEQAAWFTVGSDTAPALFMIADPQCPYCHAAWHELRQMIVDHKLRVNVVLIGGLKGSEPLAISLLARKEPGKAWFIGEGSEDGTPIAPPPAAESKDYREAKGFVALNSKFAGTYMKQGTPFFAYVGKDGKLYSAEGPKDLAAFLAGI
jgi:protein-disulfide isomerase